MITDAPMTAGLLDTSVFIARESGRPLDLTAVPDRAGVSVITMAELRLGVLQAPDDETRSRRLSTLAAAQRLEPLPITEAVAAAWALLRRRLRHAGLRMEVNDSWIAATAMAHGMAVVTQDHEFPDGVPGLTVIRV
jgi:predicted nucleic acid-binding protein